MPTLLQINACLNLSTGKIAQQIGEVLMSHGWESWIAYSGREPDIPSNSGTIKVGNYLDACVHYAGQRLFDSEGLYSKGYTNKLIKKIDEIKPHVIQLHNIHDHWLNYPLLLEYFATLNTSIVWVQHDCWAFTGGCMYFDMLRCERWKNRCNGCPDKRTKLRNQSERNFRLKKDLLSKIKNLTFVAVSDWLGDLMRESAQKARPIITIHNGTDLNTYKPLRKDNTKDGTFRILGVAAVWDARKGLDDFVKLHYSLPSDYEITLVGLSEKQIKNLPSGIKGIKRTSNVQELVKLYNEADVFVNPTYSDNFPTTNIEALACGTPVITYMTGGSPEAIDNKTGVVIEQGDVDALANVIKQMRVSPFSSIDCRKRAEQFFDKDKCFEEYVKLYEMLLGVCALQGGFEENALHTRECPG